MERWIGKVAIVTGASSGIGETLSEQLIEEGIKVIGFARRKNRLESLAQRLSSKKGKFFPFQGDVSKEEDILKVFKWAKENVGPVSILINNAAALSATPTSGISGEEIMNVLNINVAAYCICIREAIKQMMENNFDGHIINVNSTAGHRIENLPPTLGLYVTSKHALTAMTECLRLELSAMPNKIKITSLSPGMVSTEMLVNSMNLVPPEFAEIMKKMPILQPKDVANATLFALSTPKHVQITELTIEPL